MENNTIVIIGSVILGLMTIKSFYNLHRSLNDPGYTNEYNTILANIVISIIGVAAVLGVMYAFGYWFIRLVDMIL